MLSDLVLLHRPGGKNSPDWPELCAQGGGFLWQTCLRQIAVLDANEFESRRWQTENGDEIYHGDAAYAFLLQVVCGLHSPLVGETEVAGQFKTAIAQHVIPSTQFGLRFKRFSAMLFEDAKRIRKSHLEDLGSQSYGSILRREVKGIRDIHLLGSGQLVQDILPWIRKDGNEVHLHVRNVRKARAAFPQEDVRIHALSENQSLIDAEALVIAAPVTAKWLNAWLPKDHKQMKLIADLRADSAEDQIAVSRATKILDLARFFERLNDNHARIAERKAAALAAIETAVHERNIHVENRPFGWEDVCA